MESLLKFLSNLDIVILIIGFISILLGIIGKFDSKWISIKQLNHFQRITLILFGCAFIILLIYLRKQEDYISKYDLDKNYIPMGKYTKLQQKYDSLKNNYDLINPAIGIKKTEHYSPLVISKKDKQYLKTKMKDLMEKAIKLLGDPNIQFEAINSWQKEGLEFLRTLADTMYYSDFEKTISTKARVDLYTKSIKDGEGILKSVDKYYLK